MRRVKLGAAQAEELEVYLDAVERAPWAIEKGPVLVAADDDGLEEALVAATEMRDRARDSLEFYRGEERRMYKRRYDAMTALTARLVETLGGEASLKAGTRRWLREG